MKKFRFISSLPRSGSTLLCNILAQNPKFYSTHTSGCLDVLFGIRNQWDNLVEHKAHPAPHAKMAVLRATLDAYHCQDDDKIIFDKGRGWPAYLEMAEEIIGEKAKILSCIRDIPDVLSSLEKLHRETAKVRQPPGEAQNYFQFQSQEGRCEYWLNGSQVVGLTYKRILDALNRGYRDRFHFISYEALTSHPKNTLRSVYDFLDEPYFEHNFKQVDQITQEDDELHGYVDLHKIRPVVEHKPSDAVAIIGQQLVNKYTKFNLKF